MTGMIALLGGVRATVFAGLLLAALTWAGIQTSRLGLAQDAKDDAESSLATANDRIEAFRLLLVSVNTEADRQIAEAKAKALAGRQAAAEAEAEAAKLQEKLTDAQSRMHAAKADPTCADQLRIQLCAAIPLL